MTINLRSLKFTAEIAVNGKLQPRDVEALRLEIARAVQRMGYHNDFLLGDSQLELYGEKK